MPIFDAVTLNWAGKDYTIQPDQLMRAIAKVEDIITLGRLARYMTDGDLPLAKISQAYGTMLRHAGARVTDEEIYAGMFSEGALRDKAIVAVQTLQMMMIPPQALRAAPGKVEAPTSADATTGAAAPLH